MKAFATLAVLAATASALQITAPAQGTQWDFSQTNTITWQSVSTDQSSFNILLVNNADTPPSMTTLASNVSTSEGSFAFTNFVAAPGNDYVIEFLSASPSNSGILCESTQFNVTKSGVAATTTSAGSGATSSPTTSQSGSSASASHSNAVNAMAPTFGIVAPLAAVLAMLL